MAADDTRTGFAAIRPRSVEDLLVALPIQDLTRLRQINATKLVEARAKVTRLEIEKKQLEEAASRG